jgi:hypothetical protein
MGEAAGLLWVMKLLDEISLVGDELKIIFFQNVAVRSSAYP